MTTKIHFDIKKQSYSKTENEYNQNAESPWKKAICVSVIDVLFINLNFAVLSECGNNFQMMWLYMTKILKKGTFSTWRFLALYSTLTEEMHIHALTDSILNALLLWHMAKSCVWPRHNLIWEEQRYKDTFVFLVLGSRKRSPSRIGRLSSGTKYGIRWIRGWKGTRAGTNVSEKRKTCCLCRDWSPVGPTRVSNPDSSNKSLSSRKRQSGN